MKIKNDWCFEFCHRNRSEKSRDQHFYSVYYLVVLLLLSLSLFKRGVVCWFSPIQTMCVSMIKVDCSLPVSIRTNTWKKKVVSCVRTYASVYVHLSARLETSWELSVFKTEKNLLQKTKKSFVWNLKLKFAPFRFAYNRVWVCIFNVKNTYAFKKKSLNWEYVYCLTLVYNKKSGLRLENRAILHFNNIIRYARKKWDLKW